MSADAGQRFYAIGRLLHQSPVDPRTGPLALSALVNDPDGSVRMTVALSADRIEDKQAAVNALTGALSDPDYDVRWSAAFRLFQMGLGPDPGPDDSIPFA